MISATTTSTVRATRDHRSNLSGRGELSFGPVYVGVWRTRSATHSCLLCPVRLLYFLYVLPSASPDKFFYPSPSLQPYARGPMQEALYFEEVAGVPPYALMFNAVAYPIAHEEGMIPDMDDGCGGIALHQLLCLRRLRLNDNDLSGACERHVSQCRLRIYTYVQCCQQDCGGDKQCYTPENISAARAGAYG